MKMWYGPCGFFWLVHFLEKYVLLTNSMKSFHVEFNLIYIKFLVQVFKWLDTLGAPSFSIEFRVFHYMEKYLKTTPLT